MILNICICKTNFASHKQYLFGLLFSCNAKKTHIDQGILQAFLLCLKRSVSQTFKVTVPKKFFFPSVYIIHTTCFDECFLFHVVAGSRHYFLHKFIITKRVKKLALYVRYLHNDITMLLIPNFQNKASSF